MRRTCEMNKESSRPTGKTRTFFSIHVKFDEISMDYSSHNLYIIFFVLLPCLVNFCLLIGEFYKKLIKY